MWSTKGISIFLLTATVFCCKIEAASLKLPFFSTIGSNTASSDKGQPGCTTVSGKTCKFPFTWKGKLYNTCTEDEHNGPWCSTVVDHKNVHVTGEWDDCTEACAAQGIDAARQGHSILLKSDEKLDGFELHRRLFEDEEATVEDAPPVDDVPRVKEGYEDVQTKRKAPTPRKMLLNAGIDLGSNLPSDMIQDIAQDFLDNPIEFKGHQKQLYDLFSRALADWARSFFSMPYMGVLPMMHRRENGLLAPPLQMNIQPTQMGGVVHPFDVLPPPPPHIYDPMGHQLWEVHANEAKDNNQTSVNEESSAENEIMKGMEGFIPYEPQPFAFDPRVRYGAHPPFGIHPRFRRSTLEEHNTESIPLNADEINAIESEASEPIDQNSNQAIHYGQQVYNGPTLVSVDQPNNYVSFPRMSAYAQPANPQVTVSYQQAETYPVQQLYQPTQQYASETGYQQPIVTSYQQPTVTNYQQPIATSYQQPIASSYQPPIDTSYEQPTLTGYQHAQPVQGNKYGYLRFDNDYWNNVGEPNEDLWNLDGSYRIKHSLRDRLQRYNIPLHYGKIYTGYVQNPYQYSAYDNVHGADADFIFPHESHAFRWKPTVV